jgi:hypothetical protein
MLIIAVGVLMMFFALFYSISPQYHMRMMHGGVDYTPYILVAAGIILVLIPFIESASKHESVSENNSNNIWDKLKLAEKLLNEDEAMILRLIHENEGITQDSIHFKTGFSHSKISMIMKKLEDKDLIVREKFGKTYKLYLSEWLNRESEN